MERIEPAEPMEPMEKHRAQGPDRQHGALARDRERGIARPQRPADGHGVKRSRLVEPGPERRHLALVDQAALDALRAVERIAGLCTPATEIPLSPVIAASRLQTNESSNLGREGSGVARARSA